MKVILFTIGDFSVRSYGVVVALAILLAMGVAYYLTRGTHYQKHIPNMIVYVVLGAIITARIWHVFFFQWDYYRNHLMEIPAIWNGGIAIQGAIVGGFIAAAIYMRMNRLTFWPFADLVAPAIILGQAVGRIACFLNGDAFGSPTGSGFGIVYPPGTIAYDVYGSQPLWPAEVWEGQWDLIVFAILISLRNTKWPAGFMFLLYSILYAIGRFFLEFLRGDSPRYALDWTAGQWTSIIVILASIGLMIYLLLKEKSPAAEMHTG
ncbi:prolipoprotein diacylglyceryl transferase [Cohnella algarum]|uniref:prolipoprotein diacylglyceryl transferase n=1 Tax=Cohnella algarum TaxID=2044859 RepID=UPI001967A179|nr:prolipoprotein diacylglyceryl transferase [Cohnella algarum]MBN2981792.1 prolipoprotein diacylglyceryl transferase [Cohnella algarum]